MCGRSARRGKGQGPFVTPGPAGWCGTEGPLARSVSGATACDVSGGCLRGFGLSTSHPLPAAGNGCKRY
eukprot:2311308-Heterocapsa_arctica.AAC.1